VLHWYAHSSIRVHYNVRPACLGESYSDVTDVTPRSDVDHSVSASLYIVR